MAKLITYLPDILKDITEFVLLTDDEDIELGLVNGRAQQVLRDVYPETAGKYGIERWESILGIPHLASRPLEERRAAIIARLNEVLPYTDIQLRRMLFGITGSYDNFKLIIREDATLSLGIDASVYDARQAIIDMLERVLPLNILYVINPSYANRGNFFVGAACRTGATVTLKAR